MSEQGTLIIGAGIGLILFLLGASVGKTQSTYVQPRSPVYDPMSPNNPTSPNSPYERWIQSPSPFKTRYRESISSPQTLFSPQRRYSIPGGKRKTKRTKRT